MPDLTITDRDRELRGVAFCEAPLARLSDDEYGELTRKTDQAIATARREGREEGLVEAATEALDEAAYLRKHLDDPHQADGATRVERRIARLLDQPAPSGEKE